MLRTKRDTWILKTVAKWWLAALKLTDEIDGPLDLPSNALKRLAIAVMEINSFLNTLSEEFVEIDEDAAEMMAKIELTSIEAMYEADKKWS